jgi:hypothetical protein
MHALIITLVLALTLIGAASGEDRHPAFSQQMSDDYPSNKGGFEVRGSLGMGLSGLADWSTQFPFLNFAKQARNWISQREGRDWGQGEPLELDSQGWVKTIPRGGHADLIFLSVMKNLPLPDSRFVVRYRGKGKVVYRLAARKLFEQSRPGRDVIEVSNAADSYAVLSIEQTDSADPLRDISIVPQKYLTLFDSGEIFNPEWVRRLAPFRAIRFMDWTSTNNSKQENWAQRPRLDDASWTSRGVPWEITIALANKLKQDPWINVPHLADDAYVIELALLFKRELNPELRVYVEHSNEVWNWGFKQAQHANVTGRARWGDVGDAFMQWHGMRTASICDTWKRMAFKDRPERVHCVLGVQAGWRGLEKAALECPRWVAEGNEPCFKHGIDSLAIAGYFSGCLNGGGSKDGDKSELILRWAKEGDKGISQAFEQLTDGRHFECWDTVARIGDTYSHFAKTAKDYGMSLVAYEGGQHITGNASKLQDESDVIRFHMAINRDPRIGGAYTQNLDQWRRSGGTLFMHFTDIGKPTKWGSWGALEYLGQANSPKWDSLVKFSRGNRCWWPVCEQGASEEVNR